VAAIPPEKRLLVTNHESLGYFADRYGFHIVEVGGNQQLARQVAQEAGIRVVTELYTHSLTDRSGPAPTYLDMMRYNVKTIVEALGGGAR
jgi:ABC-type Zn uptake system ZnuABC Zn-binding protein ZnuA